MVKLKVVKPGKRVGTDSLQFVRRMKVELLGIARDQVWEFRFPQSYGVREKLIKMKASNRGVVSFSYGTSNSDVIEQRVHKAHYEYGLFCAHLRNLLAPPDDITLNEWARSVWMITLNYEDFGVMPSAQRTVAAVTNLDEDRLKELAPIVCHRKDCKNPFHIPHLCSATTYSDGDVTLPAKEYRVGYLVNWWIQVNRKTLSVEDRTRLVLATDQLVQSIEDNTFDVSELAKRRSKQNGHVQQEEKRSLTKKNISKNEITLSEIFEAWKLRKTNRSPNSVRSWKGILKVLIVSLGHEIAEKVTSEDIETWKRQVLASGTVAGKTFNKSHYNALKALFNLAHKKEWISHNPTVNLTLVDVVENKSVRKAYFSREVVQILSKMIGKVDKNWKWIPLLVGFTGARVGEIAQLHASQVGPDEEFLHIWCINMTELLPQQTLKTQESRRIVPLHSKFFGREFYEFVKSRKGKYLFADVDLQKTYNTSPFAPAMRESRA